MKASNESNRKPFDRPGLILLFAEKCSATPELTSAVKPVSWLGLQTSFRLPVAGGCGICSRHSGATVPDSHRVPWHL